MAVKLIAVAVAVAVAGLFVANGFTHTVPDWVAAGLLGGIAAFLFGYWKQSKVVHPQDAPPPVTGPPLAVARWVTAAIGMTWLVNYMSVTVYADRLVIGIRLVGTRTIMADQFGSIGGHGERRPVIQFEHRASGLATPVRLKMRENHPVRRAIMELVSR